MGCFSRFNNYVVAAACGFGLSSTFANVELAAMRRNAEATASGYFGCGIVGQTIGAINGSVSGFWNAGQVHEKWFGRLWTVGFNAIDLTECCVHAYNGNYTELAVSMSKWAGSVGSEVYVGKLVDRFIASSVSLVAATVIPVPGIAGPAYTATTALCQYASVGKVVSNFVITQTTEYVARQAFDAAAARPKQNGVVDLAELSNSGFGNCWGKAAS